MNNDDDIILYAEADKTPHEGAQTALLVLPKVGFTALHQIDRELVLTRLPCSKETAEKWVEQMRDALKDRFIWAEIKEVLI